MIYLTLFFLSLILTFIIKKIAIQKSLVDIPNERSSHTVATPHGGGVAIAITWFTGITYLYFTNNIDDTLYFALMVGMVISIVSYMDDLYELSAKLRLVVQFLVAIVGLYILGGLDKIDFIFFQINNQVFTNISACLIIVWFINLYNFLDGIDGYAGSEALFLATVGYLLFGGTHFLVLFAAVAGFLVFNWHKAKIFMGDVGSTLLGYNIAIFTIYYQNEGTSLFVWFILFGVFLFDASITLFRRYKNKESLTKAHKKHAYQRLTQLGFSHDKVVLLAMLVNIVLFTIVFLSQNVLLALFISVAILHGIVKFIDHKKAF